jgi:hypothetical protein
MTDDHAPTIPRAVLSWVFKKAKDAIRHVIESRDDLAAETLLN